jgi:hypothetical protein
MVQVLILTAESFSTNGSFADHSSKPSSSDPVVKINPIEQLDPLKIWNWAGSV